MNTKQIRLKIAKWALAPENISLDDLSLVAGCDFKALLKDAAKTELTKSMGTVLQEKVNEFARDFAAKELTGNVSGFGVELLAKIIEVNESLPADKKTALLGILQYNDKRDVHYFG